MQYLMSRYGGNAVIIGKGKASDSKLPENLVPLANKIKQLPIQSYPSTA